MPVGVRGELDIQAFHRSLQRLADRHPVLRTEFKEEGGKPLQRHLAGHPVRLEQVEASGWSETELKAALSDKARYAFDLENDSTWRVSLLRRGQGDYILLVIIHHIVSDLRSVIILMEELRDIYHAEKSGTDITLRPLPISFEDHVRSQRELLETDEGERLWKYWRDELAGNLPVLDLPVDYSRPPIQSFRGRAITQQIDADLCHGLKRLAASEGATLFIALLAVYKVLLYRCTGQENLIVGTPTSERRRPELMGIIGDFINMVPLRADLSADGTFRQLLGQVRDKVVGAIKHQGYPFSLIVDRLQQTRDLSRSPIFQTSFILQKFHRSEEFSRVMLPLEDEPNIPFGDLVLEPIPLVQQAGQFDLNLEMKEDDQGRLIGAWKYSAELFKSDTVSRIAGQFETLLRNIVADPDQRLADLHLLTAEQRAGAVASGQGARVELPAVATVYDLFQAQAEKRGASIAISCGETSITYAELSRRVAGFASSLNALGVGPDVLVAVLLPRGLDFISMLLAISKAGGAFLPLDPRHPLPRTLQILESSGTPLLLINREMREGVAGAFAALPDARLPRVVEIEDLGCESASPHRPAVTDQNLAYVLFTSGSTGSPKGVMVEHKGMVNHVLGKLSDLNFGEDDVLAQNGPQSFDIVVWQCLAPLAVGGRVEVFPDEVAEDPSQLLAEVERRKVTVLQLVPSMMRLVLDQALSGQKDHPPLTTLRWIVPTGDALPTHLCRRWLELYPHIPVLNTYGSTECSDDQCHYVISYLRPSDESVAVVSIGKPIHNMTAHVLDGNLTPVPVGIVGELFIGGVGVGRGYLKDPVRTALAFIPDPFSDRPGSRLYRARDLTRRRVDGDLDFLGRVDHMIKLRGFRIEPKEIEAALCSHPAVSEAVVLAGIHPSGERHLVGYVVPSRSLPDGPDNGASPESLRRFLAGCLPGYMVPTAICLLDDLPLTPNGKLDLQRLPAPEWQTTSSEEMVAPRTPTEEKIAAIWAEVLGRERVGVTDDFFAVGGDSILSIQIVARLNDIGLHFSPSDIFLHSTVAALAERADENTASLSGNGDKAEAATVLPLYVSPEHLEIALGQIKFDDD